MRGAERQIVRFRFRGAECLELRTGQVRWRLPSVGICGLFFDNGDMLYVNTTTAGLEKLKYSRQIDISEKTAAKVMKIEAETGKTLWTTQPGGFVHYVSGPFIYTLQSYQAEEPEGPTTGFETPS